MPATNYTDYLRYRATRLENFLTAVEEFHSCDTHDCETHGNWATGDPRAPKAEQEKARTQAVAKVAAAPVPSAASVKRARALPNSSLSSQNSSDRRRQRQNLFKEFGGEDRGYVVDAITGIKMHWTTDTTENPNGYPLFERGRIFTESQGGGYQLLNLLPELKETNRQRGDTPIRRENR